MPEDSKELGLSAEHLIEKVQENRDGRLDKAQALFGEKKVPVNRVSDTPDTPTGSENGLVPSVGAFAVYPTSRQMEAHEFSVDDDEVRGVRFASSSPSSVDEESVEPADEPNPEGLIQAEMVQPGDLVPSVLIGDKQNEDQPSQQKTALCIGGIVLFALIAILVAILGSGDSSNDKQEGETLDSSTAATQNGLSQFRLTVTPPCVDSPAGVEFGVLIRCAGTGTYSTDVTLDMVDESDYFCERFDSFTYFCIIGELPITFTCNSPTFEVVQPSVEVESFSHECDGSIVDFSIQQVCGTRDSSSSEGTPTCTEVVTCLGGTVTSDQICQADYPACFECDVGEENGLALFASETSDDPNCLLDAPLNMTVCY